MSPSNWTDVATSRLIPASGGMVKNVAVPRKRPGIVIFLHGVNDPVPATNQWRPACAKG